jgi:3-oxoacyl-[acyl-carrier-protein] synthase II
MGTVNPLGTSVKAFWSALLEGRSGVRTATRTDLTAHHVRIAGEVDLPDVSPHMSPKLSRRLGRFITLGQVAASQAWNDSGLETAHVERAPHRFGVIVGTGDAGNDVHYRMIRRIERTGSLGSVSPFYAVGVIPNMPPALFALEKGLRGPNFSVNSACASSNHALAVAALTIRSGLADVVFAGGTEGVVDVPGFAGFSIIGALSERNDDPATASRPFDRERDGFVLAEGAGILCLEELEHARRRGARIHAELSGVGFSCDAHDLVSPHPEGCGAEQSMRAALEDARLRPDQIGLVNAHGTSTPLGDVAEARAVERLFGNGTGGVPVHSTKSMTGHLIGAAGAVEAIAGVLALREGVSHPSINVFEQDPEIRIEVIGDQPREGAVDHVLSNGFGFGGQNGTVILSRFDR